MADMSKATAGGTSDEELMQLFRDTDDPVLTAVEVAGQLDITQQAAHARLTKAHERGEVDRKKTGSRSVVWWVPGYAFNSE